MSGWYPKAVKRELAYAKDMPARRQAKTVCLHTNGGGPNLYSWFSRPGNTVASHFQVFTDGAIEQYIPVDRQAYAEVQGNDHCVSIETQDDGHPSRPWTTEQIDAVLGICRWLGVPAQIASETGDGVNWHSLYADYNPHVHNCPGSVRVSQIKKTLIPELAGDDVTEEQLEAAIIKVLTTAKIVPIPGEAKTPTSGDKATVVQALTQDWGHDLRDETVDRQDLAVDKTQK